MYMYDSKNVPTGDTVPTCTWLLAFSDNSLFYHVSF